MKEIDYKKYKNYNSSVDIYYGFKLKNFATNNSGCSKLNNNKTIVTSTLNDANNCINICDNINICKNKSTVVVDSKNVKNNADIENNIIDNAGLDSTLYKKENIIKNENTNINNSNFNKSTIQNGKKNNKNDKNEKSYYKFINDLDIERILQQSYPNDDYTKDYLLNENLVKNNNNNNKNINTIADENTCNLQYENTSISNDNNINNASKNNDNFYNNHIIQDQRKPKKNNDYGCYNYSCNSEDFFYKNKEKNNKKINKKTGNKKGVFAGFIVVMVFIITFVLCNYFLPNSNPKLTNITGYAVCKTAYSKEDAINIKNYLSSKGSGGIIYNFDNKIYVIADLYSSYDDANSVLVSSNNFSYFDKILQISSKEYCFNNVPDNLYSVVKFALKYIDNGYTNLQKIAVSLSKKDIDIVEAKERIERLNEQILQNKKVLYSNTENSTNKNILKLRSAVAVCYEKNCDLINSSNLYCDIRDVYIENFINYIDIINDSYIK